eukprot:7736567-Pyramimonas_sp.AAC.1
MYPLNIRRLRIDVHARIKTGPGHYNDIAAPQIEVRGSILRRTRAAGRGGAERWSAGEAGQHRGRNKPP